MSSRLQAGQASKYIRHETDPNKDARTSYVDAKEITRKRNANHLRWLTFNRIPSIEIEQKAPPLLVCKNADKLFSSLKSLIGAYKHQEKRQYFWRLVLAAEKAAYKHGCIRYSRGIYRLSKLEKQVIDAAITIGLFDTFPSKKGGRRMSRIKPREELIQHLNGDPAVFDEQPERFYVELRNRKTKEPIPFDQSDKIPSTIHSKLELANEVIQEHTITATTICPWTNERHERKQLRPILYAIFLDDFQHYGRISDGGKYGHQRLTQVERKSIKIKHDPTVELDYSGMHIRMLYHIDKRKYNGDPYEFWGGSTTPQGRVLAKQMVNTLINAKSDEAAVSACNRAMCHKTKDGQMKRGKALAQARHLYDAWREMGKVRFKELAFLARRCHHKVAHHFGTDAGIKLMKIEAEICLETVYHFAKQFIPCLPVHDSFIVPFYAEDELDRVMREFYLDKLGFLPKIKLI